MTAMFHSSEKIIEVSIDELDLTPSGPYCMSFVKDLSKLERSIDQIGLIHRPCVHTHHKGKLEIVSGFRRLTVLHNLGAKSVSCVDLSEKRMSGLELLLFNFYENLPNRAFNDIEKGMFLHRLEKYLKKDEILRHYMPLLDLPAYGETLELYTGLDYLETEHREAIAGGIISMKSLSLMSRMKDIDKSDAFNFILMFKFNKNQQLRFIEYIQDLSVMKERPVRHILSDPGLQDIVRQKDNNIPQKSRLVFDYLKSKRFPCLTEAEDRFRAIINRLNLPFDCRISSDPSFEDKDLRLEILFEDGHDLSEKLKSLSNSRELADLKGILAES